jgi:hypothetical protein
LLTKILDVGLLEAGIRAPSEQAATWKYRALVGHSDSWIDGRYNDAVTNYYDRYTLTGDQWLEILIPKLLTDLYHTPMERLSSWVRRSCHLFELGSQHNFYIRESLLHDGKPIPRAALDAAATGTYTFSAGFLFLFAVALWRHFRSTPALPTTVPLLYLSLLSLALLFLFQTQPRYLYQIWYIGSIYIGGYLADGLRATDTHEG